ncbi:MAG: cyclic nucleotide-binding domain-containing protein [Desulfosarcina sp.]|nr:cyclic nucleotide-binding domain-containing protein [Desulfosarcina sp.]
MVNPEIQSTLQSCLFLKNISREHLATISDFCSIDHYKAGAYIFRQGDFGEDLFIIVDGYVFLERAMDIGSHKGSVVIDALGKGRTLGCWSALLEEDTPFGFFMLKRLCFLLRDRIQAAYGALDKI